MRNRGIQHSEVTTTNNTITTGGQMNIPDNGAGIIKVEVSAIDTATTKLIHGYKYVKLERISGTLAVLGAVTDIIAISISDAGNNAGATFTIDVSGDYVRTRVTGNTGRTIRWKIKMELHFGE
jgi:hypothetical protein